MEIEHESGEALYLQIARVIRGQIVDGTLAVGEPVPSGRAMREEHGIGRYTYGRALGVLKSEGLVATRPGEGTFVIARPTLAVVALGEGDSVAARAPTEAERAKYAISPITPVLVVTRADGAEEVYAASVTIARADCRGSGFA